MLYMNQKVLVTEEVFLYTGLSLIAEVGGYVGLFLGVSVNQISVLTEILLDLCARKMAKVTGTGFPIS